MGDSMKKKAPQVRYWSTKFMEHWREGQVPAYCRPGLSKRDRAFLIISDMVKYC